MKLFRKCPQFTVFLSLWGWDITQRLLEDLVGDIPFVACHYRGLSNRVNNDRLTKLVYIPNRFHFDYTKMLNELEYRFSSKYGRSYLRDIATTISNRIAWNILDDRETLAELCPIAAVALKRRLAADRTVARLAYRCDKEEILYILKSLARTTASDKLPGGQDEAINVFDQIVSGLPDKAGKSVTLKKYLLGTMHLNIARTAEQTDLIQTKVRSRLTAKQETSPSHSLRSIHSPNDTVAFAFWRTDDNSSGMVNMEPATILAQAETSPEAGLDGADLLKPDTVSTTVNWHTKPISGVPWTETMRWSYEGQPNILDSLIDRVVYEKYDPRLTGQVPDNPMLRLVVTRYQDGGMEVQVEDNLHLMFKSKDDARKGLHLT